jgi:hypothetical protein
MVTWNLASPMRQTRPLLRVSTPASANVATLRSDVPFCSA